MRLEVQIFSLDIESTVQMPQKCCQINGGYQFLASGS